MGSKKKAFNMNSLISREAKPSNKLNSSSDYSGKQSVEYIKDCPECKSDDIVYGTHDIICGECGRVIDERRADTTSHGWRVFDQGDVNKIHAERVKADGNMCTVISYNYKDYAGNQLTPETKSRIYQLRKTEGRKLTRDEKVTREGMNDLKIIAGKLGLPDGVRNEAIVFFKNHIKNRSLKGGNITNVILTVLFTICKRRGVPFKIREFAKLADIKQKKLTSIYSELMSEQSCKDRKISSPLEYLPRFSSKLKLTGEAESTALFMLKTVMAHHTYKKISVGKEPCGYTAASVYLASMEHKLTPIREMRLVAIQTEVAESTLKKRVEEMIEILGLDRQKYKEEKYKNFNKKNRIRYKIKKVV